MPRRKRHSEHWEPTINYGKRYINALKCPVPRANQLTGEVWIDKDSGACYYPAEEYLELPMANTRNFAAITNPTDANPSIPSRIHMQETLEVFHRVKFTDKSNIFWVKFAQGKRKLILPKLHGSIVLENGLVIKKCKIKYVARRKGLKSTAVVVVDF